MNPSTFNHYHDALDPESENPDINARAAIPTLTALSRTVMRQLADGKTTDELLAVGLWEDAIWEAADEVLEMAEFADTRNALESPPPGGKAMKPRAYAPWTKEEDAPTGEAIGFRMFREPCRGVSAQPGGDHQSAGQTTPDFVRRPHNQFSSQRASL